MASRITASPPASYTRTAIALHWLIAILMTGGFALGWVMTDIPGLTPKKLEYYAWHKWIGVTVLALAIIRLLWRATHVPPPLPQHTPPLARAGAHAAHALLYVLMVAVPVTGYLHSSAANIPVVYLGVVPLPRLIAPNPALKTVLQTAHAYLNWALLAIVALHTAAAIKHQWLDRDRVLSRMLPFLK